ncbi:nicotinate (nicotinamide) nucleotide adenylyltransferase [Bacteroidales bacterium]|nr:nicotinate (nicotinamide) nucleotide adenylyltransferase [Bacteroidales bacterium]
MKTGLFFGSFNPIHIGHLALANYIVSFTDIQELWFVVSPQNPLKSKSTLLPDYHRLEMVHLAINETEQFKVSDVEFRMPKPSYTIDTLTYLSEKHPKREFVFIMGGDNLLHFHKWKNHELIEEKYRRYVYPRPGVSDEEYHKHKNIERVNAPLMEISSSFIRAAIKDGRDVRYFAPKVTWDYIIKMGFYT